MKKKEEKGISIYLYITAGLLIFMGIFIYLKIIYFPSRTEDKDAAVVLSFLQDQGYIDNARSMDIGDLRAFTGDYIVSSNTILSLEHFYAKTHDKKTAISLLQMYITHYRFDDAFALIKDLYKNDIDFSLIPGNTFLYILFNSSQLSPTNYDLIAGLIDEYLAKGRIDDSAAILYKGLLSIYKGDQKQFYSAVDQLSGVKAYAGLVQGVADAQKASKEIDSSIPYYADGLSALVLLQEGYFRVAQKRAVSIRTQDPKYVLPYQILAKAALLQSHREEASQYFDTLLKVDTTHPSQYQFGLCTSNFWLMKYDTALLHCQQVKDRNLPDALRYILLSYYQRKDWQGMMDAFQQMLAKKKVSENDYYTFFDIVFFQPFVSDKDFSSMQKYYVSVVLPYLNQCVADFGVGSTVCKYGQVGFYLYKNQIPKAYKDLLFLASHHPTSYVFKALGEYYESVGDKEKAKAYYLRAAAGETQEVIDISSAKSGAGNKTMNE